MNETASKLIECLDIAADRFESAQRSLERAVEFATELGDLAVIDALQNVDTPAEVVRELARRVRRSNEERKIPDAPEDELRSVDC
jgi:hypothetical protein